MSLTGESSSREPAEKHSIEPLPEGFSKFHLHERYVQLKKSKNKTLKDMALYNEYYELYQSFTAEDLDDELYHSCLSESNLTFMIVLLYISNMLNIEEDETCLYSPHFRRSERFRLIISNAKVSNEEVHLMVDFASKITGPHKIKSHLQSVKACIEYAKQWVEGDSNTVSNTSPISYSVLKECVKEIVGSDFFKSFPPHPLKKDFCNVVYMEVTLESWLKSNENEIVHEITLTSEENTFVEAFRLSPNVRRILWGILQIFGKLHQQAHVCEILNTRNIYIGTSLEVDFSRVKMIRGRYTKDFKKLKSLISSILKYANSSVPDDVIHYINLIDEEKEDDRDLLYRHPFVWSSCDVVKNIYIFSAIFESSASQNRAKMTSEIKRDIPNEIRSNWRQNIPPNTPYYKLMVNWAYFRTLDANWEMLFYIRDGFAHIHDYVNEHHQSLYKTENEIFAMFPLYLAHFIQVVCKIEAFRSVLSTSYNEEEENSAKVAHT